MRGRTIVISSILFCLIGIGLAVFMVLQTDLRAEDPTPSPSITPVPSIPPFTTLILQEEGDERHLSHCRQGVCQDQPLLLSADDNTVADADSLYYYITSQGQGGKKILQRRQKDTNQIEHVIEETALVRPRDLIISPDGRKVLFWLDNIDAPKKKLTELWMYDAKEGSTRLLVEQLVQTEIITRPRWNRASSHVWFLREHAPQEKAPTITNLMVVNTQPTEVMQPFGTLAWSELHEVTHQGVMDINQTGKRLAYREDKGETSRLVIIDEEDASRNSTLTSNVVYVQWLEDGSLLYITQEPLGFTLWRLMGTIHRQIAKQTGQFRGALGDNQGMYLAVVAQTGTDNRQRQFTYDITTGNVVNDYVVPFFGGDLHVVYFRSESEDEPQLATVTRAFEDEELVAFIDKHYARIAQEEAIKPTHILMTPQINTLYVDYRTQHGEEHRMLVTVRDVIHPEWSIRGRYTKTRGEWHRTIGAGLTDPAIVRLYEWEDGVNQWILKSTADS